MTFRNSAEGWRADSHPWSSFFLWSCMLMMVSVVFKIWLTINGDIFHFKYFWFLVFYSLCSFSSKEKNRKLVKIVVYQFLTSYRSLNFFIFIIKCWKSDFFFFFGSIKRFGSLVPDWFHFQLSDLCLNFHAFKTGPFFC